MKYSELIRRIIRDGKLTFKEYELMLKTANEDGVIDAEEREGILKVLKMKQDGDLELVNDV